MVVLCMPIQGLASVLTAMDLSKPTNSAFIIPTTQTPPQVLPTEILLLIADYLPTSDIRHLRLASNGWATIFAEKLFQHDFNVRPDPERHDMVRLRRVSRRPDLAMGLRHLRLHTGDMDLAQLRDATKTVLNQIGHPFKLQTAENIRKEQQTYSKMRNKIFENSDRYLHCDDLTVVLSRLPNLESLSVDSVGYPFLNQGLWLEDAWNYTLSDFAPYGTTTHQQPETAVARYRSVLTAMADSMCQVKTLGLDLMPIDCIIGGSRADNGFGDYFVDSAMLTKMTKAVQWLRNLSVCFVSCLTTEWGKSDVAISQSIGQWLCSMENLRSLDLTWGLRENCVVQDPEFTLGWQTIFYGNTWSSLRSLRLQRVKTPAEVLCKFLENHKSTLESLHLSDDAVELDKEKEETHKSVLNFMRVKLNLKRLQYFTGYSNLDHGAPWCYSLDSSDAGAIYSENWDPVPHSDPNAVKLLEDFVVRKAPWPMAKENPDGRKGWLLSEALYDAHPSAGLVGGDDALEYEWDSDERESEG